MIANQKKNEDTFIDVPETDGRINIVGKVVSTRWETFYTGYNRGHEVMKGMIIVETPEGNWKTWGTIPSNLVNSDQEVSGSTISFDAKVQISNKDKKMSFFSRPTNGKFVEV